MQSVVYRVTFYYTEDCSGHRILALQDIQSASGYHKYMEDKCGWLGHEVGGVEAHGVKLECFRE